MANNKWPRYPLSEICEINPGKKELQGLSKETEVSFLPMACVSEDGKILSQEKRKLKDVIKGFTYFRDRDVLLAKITPCFENGKRAIAQSLLNGVGFGSTEFHVLRPNGVATSRWLFYAISQDDFRNIAKSQMTGTAGQKRVPKKVLDEFRIPLPKIQEQEKISEQIETQFTRLDAAIKSLKIIQAKLEIYRQSVLKAVFKDFPIKKLGDISALITKGASPKWQGISYTSKENGVLFVTSENVRSGFLDLTQEKYVEKKFNDRQKRSILKSGDILLNIVGASIGRAAIFANDRTANINQAVALIRLVNRKYQKYINYFLNSNTARAFYQKEKVDVARANLSLTDVGNIPIPLCPESELIAAIEQIESCFSVIDKVEETVTTTLAKTERLRKSILKAAFEGKLVNI